MALLATFQFQDLVSTRLWEQIGEKGDESTDGQQQLVFCDGKESVATGPAMENGAKVDEESEGKHSE